MSQSRSRQQEPYLAISLGKRMGPREVLFYYLSFLIYHVKVVCKEREVFCKNMRKIQIGIVGSCSDLKYSKPIEKLAKEIGYCIAKSNAVLIFGAEKDLDSLSSAACRGAKSAEGTTVGITYGKGLNVLEKDADVVIASGLERGGGREFVFVLSCDVIISINGGSGTLTEIAIAYQANIPVVALRGTGGWSDKLIGKYLDSRKRIKILSSNTPKEAVETAINLVEKSYE